MADHPLYSAFGRAVDAAMQSDDRVILLTADTARDHFVYDLQEKYPGRAIDCGIAEQHMVSMASALALSGFKPIVVTYARFLTRAYEQIYNQVTEGTAVVYVGGLAGRLPPEGPGQSHEAQEDGESMGHLLSWSVEAYTPKEVAEILDEALRLGDGSTYMRLRHVI